MPVTSVGSTSTPARAAGRRRPRAPQPDADDQLEQLRFLHEVARLATTARTWDELLETVVDRTRDVLHADVSSLYLLDRDGAYLTLAATNGLDRFQIGRARIPFGEGVTGRVAADRMPLAIPDVKADARFLWVRGIDQRRFVASMLSVPLTWHDQIVGVLNVQTVAFQAGRGSPGWSAGRTTKVPSDPFTSRWVAAGRPFASQKALPSKVQFSKS